MDNIKQLEDKLNKNSHRFSTISIAIAPKTTEIANKFTDDNVSNNIEECIEALKESYIINPQALYTIRTYKKGDLVEKNKVETFQWRLEEKKQHIGAIGLDPMFVAQLVEAEKKAAVAEYQMSQMAAEMLEDDEEQDEEPDYLGSIMPIITPHIPALIEGIMAMLPSKRPLAVSGVDEVPQEAIECLNILMDNGVTLNHLQKLVKKAKDGSLKPLLMML
jgi:hypothetical protein